jgi:toxin-antitoxin system PIN domain toxin
LPQWTGAVVLPDVSVLVHAHRSDSLHHAACKKWLESVLAADEAYGVSELVLSGFIRIVTHAAVFSPPSSLEDALAFSCEVLSPEHAVPIAPSPRHWDIFAKLCRDVDARGNLVPDAYLAALAIESGSEWISTDGDYARFPGLKWRRPF